MTRVISVRGKKRHELEADPNFVYVGRSVRFTTWDRQSPWHNPFSVKQHGDKAIGKFIGYLNLVAAGDPSLRDDIVRDLRGKTLGCWCVDDWTTDMPTRPACHAVVLACIAEGISFVETGKVADDERD